VTRLTPAGRAREWNRQQMQQTRDDHAGKKVLTVDDERVLTDTIGYNLRRAGYATAAAYDGPAALTPPAANAPTRSFST
jgi:hypothetical protein